MRHFVRQLRKKPAHVKERIALGTTFVGTVFLLFFWVTIVRYEIVPKQKLAETSSPLQIVGGIFQNAYKGTVASVGSINGNGEIQTGEGKLIVVPQEDILGKENEASDEGTTQSTTEISEGTEEESNLEVNQ